MQVRWITGLLTLLKEIILIALLALVLTTMIGGFLVIGILNLPQSLWDPQNIYAYVGFVMILLAPVLALARVIEWWIAAYMRFSALFPHGEQ